MGELYLAAMEALGGAASIHQEYRQYRILSLLLMQAFFILII
jgi:hypothetical protein